MIVLLMEEQLYSTQNATVFT